MTAPVKRNYHTAFKWITRAADQGYIKALSDLGWMYDRGLGVAESPREAAQLYMKVLQLGNSDQHATVTQTNKDIARDLKRLPRSKWKPATVAELQKLLKDLGYYTGEIDGKIGPGTRSAMGKACQC